LTVRPDDGADFESDDPLAVILRPASAYLGPPPGRYEAIRRAAARRRVFRAAAGVGLSCAVAVLIVLPFRTAAPDAPASPAVPLAPPTVSGHAASPTASGSPAPSAPPTPTASPEHNGPLSTGRSGIGGSRSPSSRAVPTREPSATPTSPRGEQPVGGDRTVPTPESVIRR
jgi:hypothetical protein